MKRLALASLGLWASVSSASLVRADSVAYVVNEQTASISVVDVGAGSTLNHFSTAPGFHPAEAVLDAKSGRLFVAGDGRLMGYDARLPDGRGRSETLAPEANQTCLALDDVGRRVFMTHKRTTGVDGLVTEFKIADPLNPVAVSHTVPGVLDLRLAAWDAKFKRLYVVAADGRVARTSPGSWTWSTVAGAGAPLAAGIIADPANGGVWIATRFPGRIVRITDAGARSQTDLPGARAPRGMSWDGSSALLVAMEDLAQVWSFNTATGSSSVAMSTDPSPVDAGRAANGRIVSANRVGDHQNGSATIGPSPIRTAFAQENPVALVLADIPRLTADPTSASYCYNQLGDNSEKTFTVSNTKLSRSSLNIAAPTIVGLNPGNYVVTTTGCNAATLAWGAACSFKVRFYAQGPSVELPPPFPGTGFRPPTWPAEIRVTATNDSTVDLRIPVRGALSASLCPL
jgi:sugar lactone lactonase YvrE